MSGGLTTESLRVGLQRISVKMEACADEFNALDGALGDGDIGVTMVRGCRAVLESVGELPEDVGRALMACAQAFTKTSGSSYGTLLATGLMSAAKATRGRTVVPWTEVGSLLRDAVSAMAKRGRSALGEKTVLDVIEAAGQAAEGLGDPARMLEAADQAAGATLDQFRAQPAKQGRARIFGEKSVGLDDPGQVVFKRILEGLRTQDSQTG